MGVEESYEYGKCNKDNQNTGNCRVAETKNRNPESVTERTTQDSTTIGGNSFTGMNGKKSFRKWMNI